MDSERESECRWVWGLFPGFLLVNHFDLPGAEFIFDESQDPPTCACMSLSQDGIHRRGLWVVSITYCGVVAPPSLTSKGPFYACILREVP